MADKELNQRVQRIAGLVNELERLGDPKIRASVKELLQLVMDMHAAGFERILEVLFDKGEIGRETIDQLGADPLVSSLLVLYGLHPEELEQRVLAALRKVSPELRSHGIEVALTGIEEGAVTIRAAVVTAGCGSTSANAKTVLENAIFEAAPDVSSIVIEGLDGKPASGFVPLTSLRSKEITEPVEVRNPDSHSMQPLAGG